ncbi:vascular cell adhesion protein 1-like isoform X3 [Gambusia affinis]|uniref:vascular cell adhesion protein 1-like isoform X3 n=1 Tax=Gambusia affinis TaxID=33528 RepID=UPI001CDD3EC9|nr:vascular cell adhesion protein 1-like isoform X3 [Gambusia affinis]
MKKLCHPSNNILIVSNLLLVFFLPGALAHCGSSLTQHMHTPPEIEALIGSCVEIPCRFDTLPGFDISKPIFGIWMKNKASHHEGATELIFNSSGSINTHQMEITGDLTAKNCSTRIPDLTADHTDKYFLRIENGATTATFCDDPFTLTVNDSPWTPIIVVSGRNLREHQSVTITCSAYTPCLLSPPELTWNLKKDSRRQIEKSTDGTLTSKLQESITLSDEHDGYTINCTARYPVRNGFKQAESTKLLNVLYAPRNTSASISPSALVSVGSRVELSCSSRAKPPPSFSWFRKERQRFIKESSEQAYSFSASLQEAYECEAQNTLGREESETICVDIIGAPVTPKITIPPGTLKEGKTVTITCSASTPCKNSLPELTWNLQEDSHEQTEENADGTFTRKIQKSITLTDKHDRSNISCSSRHPFNGQRNIVVTNVTLNVLYAPTNISVSVHPSQLVRKNSVVSGVCTSNGNPPPTVRWVYYGPGMNETTPSEKDHWYDATEQAEFYCYARNEMGYLLTDLFCIDLYDLPLTPVINIPSGELMEGQTVTITCSATSGCPLSRPELTWNLGQDSLRQAVTRRTKYSSEIQKNITLTEKYDGYNISCSSSHPLNRENNTVVTNVTLNVLYAPRNTSVSIHPSDSVLNSTHVIMTCSSRAKPPPDFVWLKEDKLGLRKVSESYNMEFIAHERGDYHCMATNNIGSEKSESICIDLLDHPFTPAINIPSGELVAGQTVTITCSASSCPRSRPELTWNLGQDSLRQAVTSPAIYASEIQKNITLTDEHDGYNISCSSRHPFNGQRNIVVTNVTLNVLYAPRNTSVSIHPSDSVLNSTHVIMTCSSRAKPPPISFIWYKEDKLGLRKVSESYKMEFIAHERGDYHCMATNNIGSGKSESICIDLIDLPLTPTINIPSGELVAGQTVTITCSASSCPRSRPELTWNLGQDSLRQAVTSPAIYASEIQKSITLTDEHDGYNIRCSSRHPAAEKSNIAETEVTLSVSYAPKETSASISPSGLLSAGSRVELSCSSRAKPPPSFTWFRISEHGDINVSVGKVYNFSATRPEEGEYYCEATNEIGSEKSTSICIDISDAPLTPRISISTYTLKERQSVTVTCSASTRCPHSPPELTWNLQQDSLRQTEKNADGTFTTKIQTTITLTDTHDGYNIRCSARYPMAGKSKTEVAEMTLNVPYAPKNTLASINPSAGTLVELSCSSRAKPPPKITWFKKGPKGITKVATGNSLKVEFTEGDEYYCVAANKLGKQKSSPINLTVKGPSGPEVWILALIGAVGIILLVIIVLIYDNFKSS